jgi:hypothetical protein
MCVRQYMFCNLYTYITFYQHSGDVSPENYSNPLYPHLITLMYLFTYLLTPCSRVFLEKLTGLQLDKKFPEFYGTRRFITAFTNARHMSLS